MKNFIYYFLNKLFGKKKYFRFFLVLKNIGIQGLNYRNTNIEKNGELFLIKKIARFYQNHPHDLNLFDVGANVGNYSKQLLKHFKVNDHVFAFEPFSVPYLKLSSLMHDQPNLFAFQFGFSNKNEKLTIYTSNEYNEIGGLYDRSYIFNTNPLDKQELCDFKTIDNFCDRHQIKHIHFLKIDVEGHELNVLQGAQKLLDTNEVDFIQFEFGAGNHFSKTYLMDFFRLLSNNYELHQLLSDGLIHIPTYNSDLEMQVLINYVAINKNHVAKFKDILLS